MKKWAKIVFWLIALHAQPSFALLKAAGGTPGAVINSGSFTSGDCVQFANTGSTNALISDTGSACGSGGGSSPGGSTGQVQYNAGSGNFGGATFGGDCTWTYTTGALVCTKSSGTAFGTAAFVPAPANTGAVSHQFFTAYASATGAFTQAQPACGDLSNAATSCSTDTTNAANISSGTLPAGRLPNPSATTLGGIESLAAVSHNWINTISTSGVPSATQPTCADISNAGTVCTQNTGTSGATVPFLNGANIWGSTNIFASAAFPTLAVGNGILFASGTNGGILAGMGSTNDIEIQNKNGTNICITATGTTTLNCTGLQLGGTAVLTGNQSITLSSDVTGSGTTAITTTIANNAVSNAKAAQMAANTMKGNWTGSTANASDNAMPSCSDTSGNHLNYVSGTGITCGTSDAHVGTVTSVTFTGDGTVESSTPSGAVTTSGTVTAALANAGAGTVLGNATSSSAAPTYTSAPVLGKNATTAGTLGLANGGGSGTTITLQNLGNTSAYNFNLPTTAGGTGQILTSQGGGSTSMTWASDNVGGGMFNYSDNGVTVTANTYYSPIGGGGIPQTTEANVDVPSPSATTVANLQVGISTAIGAGNTITFTLRDASSDTAITCQIAGASATTCQDLTHSVNVAQGDLIDWKIVTTGTIIVTPTITISANNGTSNVGVTSIIAGSGLTGGTITTTGTIAEDKLTLAVKMGAGETFFGGI